MRRLGVPLVLAAVVSVAAVQAEEVLVGAVVAEVNDRAITLYELSEAVRNPMAELRSRYAGEELRQKAAELLAQTVRQLVWNALLVDEAERQLSDREKQQAQLTVDRVIKDMIGTAGSLVNLRQQLDQLGLTLAEEKRRQTEKQMVQMLLDREVRQLVSVRAEEVRQNYQERRSEFCRLQQVRIRQVLIRYDDYESKAEARKTAQQVLEKLRQGGDFARLAQLYSHGPYASQGGLWEFMEPGGFIEPVDEAAFRLAQGQLSDLIEGPTGYHILRVEEVKPERTVPFSEAQADIYQKLYRQHYQERYRSYVEGLQKRARVRINERYLQAAVQFALAQLPASPEATPEAPTP